jgi:hypothetical protein
MQSILRFCIKDFDVDVDAACDSSATSACDLASAFTASVLSL